MEIQAFIFIVRRDSREGKIWKDCARDKTDM